jgi:hypothetical protein
VVNISRVLVSQCPLRAIMYGKIPRKVVCGNYWMWDLSNILIKLSVGVLLVMY